MIKVILGANLHSYLQKLTIPMEQQAALYKTSAIVYASSQMENNTWKIEVDIEDKHFIPIIEQKVRQCVSALLPLDCGLLEIRNSIPFQQSSE